VLVQGRVGARVGARAGARARCWRKGCNTLLKTLELCLYHISPISEPFFGLFNIYCKEIYIDNELTL
jgi:hypothetical protein